jgi:hypothetical protein
VIRPRRCHDPDALSIALVAAQTVITPPSNSYSAAGDVQLGQQAAAQAEQRLPIMRDDEVCGRSLLFTTLLRDGSLFYMILVARDASDVYPSTFQRIAGSIQIDG